MNSAIELLAVHFMQWSCHISFPELAVIPLIRLKKFYERSTVESLKRVVKRLMDMVSQLFFKPSFEKEKNNCFNLPSLTLLQVEQNVEFVQKKRDDVAFSPKDQESVDQFLQVLIFLSAYFLFLILNRLNQLSKF